MLSFGKKSFLDAINNHCEIKQVYFVKNHYSWWNSLGLKHIKVTCVDEAWFAKYHDFNHQFFAYEIAKKPELKLKEYLHHHSDQNKQIILILDKIEDPHNFGAILRTCDAFGVNAIIYKKHHQVSITDTVNNISRGATNYLNLICENNLSQAIDQLKDAGFWIYATALDTHSTPYFKINYPEKTVIIVGNENKGVSVNLLKKADASIYIPMYGHVQSLNVSVAAGVILGYLKIGKK